MIGTSHLRSGDPCQDASACATIPGAHGGEVLVAIACDGAGSARLSQLGSSEACRFVLERIRSLLAERLPVAELSRDLSTQLVRDLQAHLRDTAEAAGASLRDLACTLVASVVDDGAAAFFQVGDGVVIVGPRHEPRDEFSWMFWPHRGEYANSTVFLSDPSAAEHLQHATVSHGIDELALLTDGIQGLVLDYRQHSAHSPFFSRMLAPLRASRETGHLESLSAALATYLDSPPINDRTDDDKTLVLASRRVPADE